MNGHRRPWRSAPAATCAARTESGPMNCSGRAASLTLPLRTYWPTIAGIVVGDASRQTGHCRSRYSVTVTGAFGLPSIPACSGMPANRDEVPVDAGGVLAGEPPEDEMAMPPTTSTAAAAVAAASRHSVACLDMGTAPSDA